MSPAKPTRQARPSGGTVPGRVELQKVTFGYDKSRPVLKDVGFSIQPGEMVGVVGRSGSGKSTLVSLIARLYETDSGGFCWTARTYANTPAACASKSAWCPRSRFSSAAPSLKISPTAMQAAPERIILGRQAGPCT